MATAERPAHQPPRARHNNCQNGNDLAREAVGCMGMLAARLAITLRVRFLSKRLIQGIESCFKYFPCGLDAQFPAAGILIIAIGKCLLFVDACNVMLIMIGNLPRQTVDGDGAQAKTGALQQDWPSRIRTNGPPRRTMALEKGYCAPTESPRSTAEIDRLAEHMREDPIGDVLGLLERAGMRGKRCRRASNDQTIRLPERGEDGWNFIRRGLKPAEQPFKIDIVDEGGASSGSEDGGMTASGPFLWLDECDVGHRPQVGSQWSGAIRWYCNNDVCVVLDDGRMKGAKAVEFATRFPCTSKHN